MTEDDRDPIHCECGRPKLSTDPMCKPCMGTEYGHREDLIDAWIEHQMKYPSKS